MCVEPAGSSMGLWPRLFLCYRERVNLLLLAAGLAVELGSLVDASKE